MGFKSTYSKHLSKHLLWKILRLSLVSLNCLQIISFYLYVFLLSRFWPPALIKAIAIVVLFKLFLPSFLQYTTVPTPIYIVSLSGGSYHQMSSLNSSVSVETDSQNQTQLTGFNILLPGPSQGGRGEQSPFLPVAPFVPQPLGVHTTAPIQILPSGLAISHVGSPTGLPSSPGQLSVGSPIQSSKYNITSNSLPVLGERQSNLIL